MPDEKKKILCPDPDCGTENDSDSDSCGKCKLDLAAYFTLDRVMGVRDKVAKKEAADKIELEKKNKPVRRGAFDGLMGKRKP
jgi:hypothetical protein